MTQLSSTTAHREPKPTVPVSVFMMLSIEVRKQMFRSGESVKEVNLNFMKERLYGPPKNGTAEPQLFTNHSLRTTALYVLELKTDVPITFLKPSRPAFSL
ncbi:hypothetical protein TNCV_947001 [Trichonephila clavipes]|nr:hypothetical protein TNCV_947001 [Trichonephila clavipes]